MTSPDPAADTADGATWRVACLGATAAGAAALAASIASLLPDVAVEEVDFGATSGAPEADLFVIDAVSDAARAIDQLRILRARGAPAPAILVGGGDVAAPPSLGDHHQVEADALPTALPNVLDAVAAERERLAHDPGVARLVAGLRETRQLIAAGQIARRVKHDINNPLAALLAEAQLLELEELGDEAREATSRIVELARRVIDEARRLEGPKLTL